MPGSWRFGRFVLEPAERRLYDGERAIALGNRAFDLLCVLVERAGHLVTKGELLEQAWPGLVVEENNLQVQVSALRRALGNDSIATVAGKGYRFELPVARVEVQSSGVRAAPALRSPPEPLFPLIGRAADVRDVVAACSSFRWVSLVGPAGVGKTRLALEVVAEAQRIGLCEGTAFCDLSALTDEALVPQSLASATGIDATDQDALSAMAEAIGSRRVLIVVDNAEHVRHGAARAVAGLLARTAACRVLVTSQVPLDVAGECVRRITPLALPEGAAPASSAASYAAIQCFVAYAQAADHRFRLDSSNVAAIVEICRRLDGLPLALQLAAARVSQFGIDVLAQRLDQRFRLLAREGVAQAPRQQTLEAAIAWSCQLLEPGQRAMLRRLALFNGPFTMDDVAALSGAASTDALESDLQVARLVERSLVEATLDQPRRYRVLETVRLYAARDLCAEDVPWIERGVSVHESRADAAMARSAAAAAAIDYATALDLNRRLPASRERDERELVLQLKLGPAVQSSSSPGAPRCEVIYARAVELARMLDDRPACFKALWGYWHMLSMVGRDEAAAALTPQLTSLAEALDDDGYRLEACHARFTTAQLLGDVATTLEQTRLASDMYDRERHGRLGSEYGGHDPGVCALGQGAVATWLAGDTARAMALADEAERIGATFEDAYSQAVGHYYAAMTYSAARDARALERSAQALLGVSRSHAMAVLEIEGRLFAGRARFELGCRDGGLEQLEAAYAEIVGSGDFGFVPFYATLLADACIDAGDLARAHATLEQALQIAKAGQGFFVPELHRLSGRIAQATNDHSTARDRYARAAALAASQGARALEQRARADLASLPPELTGPIAADVAVAATSPDHLGD